MTSFTVECVDCETGVCQISEFPNLADAELAAEDMYLTEDWDYIAVKVDDEIYSEFEY